MTITTDPTSCFKDNKVALKMDVLCDNCPGGGVGIFNPGFWGMVLKMTLTIIFSICIDSLLPHCLALLSVVKLQNIEKGKKYKLIFYATSTVSTSITASLVDASGTTNLASTVIM